jgi:hypothetical protein
LTPTTPSRFRRWAPRFGIALLAWIIVAGLASRFVPNVPVASLRTGAGDGFVVGALHMHTRLSDGSGTVEDLVDAALEHGLDFIVVSDHDIQRPSSFEYRRGVLVAYAEELGVPNMGHALLLDVDTVRLSEPDSVDRNRGRAFHRTMGDAGLRIAAHPNHGRRYWWDRTMGNVDAMEVWNADTEWRDDTVIDWLEALTLLPFEPELGMMALVDRPARNLALLDSASANRRITATCAVDAHARIEITDDWFIPFPSYRMTLGLLQQHVSVPEPFNGDPERDGRMLVDALRDGAGYCALGGMADDGGVRVEIEGDELVVSLPADGPQTRIRVYRDGEVVLEAQSNPLRAPASTPGSYRVEVEVRARLLRTRWLPWIITGPIRIGPGPDDAPTTILGTFEDDYGNRYTISDSVWIQEPSTAYEVVQWRGSERFVVARNASTNASDAGLWTRIDWIEWSDMEPWSWGFCLSTWNALSFADARETSTADRSDPRTGCGGFPFSRMKRID